MKKEKLIFFGSIGVVILIMVIYGVSVFSKKTTSSAAADFTVPDLVEKDKTKEEYNNRLKKANAYQEPEAKQDLSKTANFKTYQSEPNNPKEKKDSSKVDLKNQYVNSFMDDGINIYALTNSSFNPFISTDKGASWKEIKEDKKLYAFRNLVITDKYFIASNGASGVYISQNKGKDWTPLNFGLGNLRVSAIFVKDSILFAGTNSGVWIHPL